MLAWFRARVAHHSLQWHLGAKGHEKKTAIGTESNREGAGDAVMTRHVSFGPVEQDESSRNSADRNFSHPPAGPVTQGCHAPFSESLGSWRSCQCQADTSWHLARRLGLLRKDVMLHSLNHLAPGAVANVKLARLSTWRDD